MRYFIEIAYKGTAYHGWQKQQNAISVQQVIEEALNKILPLPVETLGSGRTDTGVHAEQQYIHLDWHEELKEYDYQLKLNKILPHDISIKSIRQVTDNAHARFDAISRSYEYRISRVKNPFRINLCYLYPRPLNIDLMNQAAAFLLEFKDFESFSKVHTDVNNFLCNITRAEWVEEKEGLIFHITANRFLRGMVRAITGTLMDVGSGKTSVDDFKTIIEKKDRTKAGRSVPAQGLFLTRVDYPESIFV